MIRHACFRWLSRLIIGVNMSLLMGCESDFSQAQSHLEKQQYPQAQQALQRVLAKEPDHLEAKSLLGESFFYTNQIPECITTLREVLQQDPNEPTARQAIHQLTGKLRQFDDLLKNKPTTESLRAYVSQAPNHYLRERAQWLWINLLLQSGNGTKAAPLWEELHRTTQDTLILQLLDWQEARKEPQKYHDLLRQYPRSELRSAWFWELADWYRNQDDIGQANAVLVEFKKEVRDELEKGAILRRQGEYNLKSNPMAALNYYKTFIRLNPESSDVRPVIYKIREQLAKWLTEEDRRFLAEAAGQAYMYQTASQELLLLPSPSAPELDLAAQYAMKSNLYGQAADAWQRLIKTFPGSDQADRAMVGLVTLQRHGRQYGAALQRLQQLKQQFKGRPALAAVWWEEGRTYDNMDKDPEKVKAYRRLIQEFPEDKQAPEALWHVVWDHYLHDEYDQGLDWIRKFSDRLKGHELESRFSYWTGRLYELTDQHEKSRTFYETLQKGPLWDYYTHRAKERLRVMDKGDADQFAVAPYKGYKPLDNPYPSLAQDFKAFFEGGPTARSPFEQGELKQLLYMQRFEDFLSLTRYTGKPEWQVLRGHLQNQLGKYYDTITRYRYEAEKDQVYIPVVYPLAFFESIEKEALKYNLNPFLVSGLIWQESQYKPDIRSWVGATGLMQIMPETGQHISQELKLKSYKLADPATNIMMGTWYLNYTHQSFDGNSLFAVASYNAGRGPVYKWEKQFGRYPLDAVAESIPYPETREYVKHVFTGYWIYKHLYGK